MSFDPQPSHYVNGSFIIWHLVGECCPVQRGSVAPRNAPPPADPRCCVRMRANIVAKGGQMQIGYGPDADGEFEPLAVVALEYAGRWLETNGEAIYYSRPA
jgi:hypothetical protein